jgi:hypothetical protein
VPKDRLFAARLKLTYETRLSRFGGDAGAVSKPFVKRGGEALQPRAIMHRKVETKQRMVVFVAGRREIS